MDLSSPSLPFSQIPPSTLHTVGTVSSSPRSTVTSQPSHHHQNKASKSASPLFLITEGRRPDVWPCVHASHTSIRSKRKNKTEAVILWVTAVYFPSMCENWKFCEYLLNVSDLLIHYEHSSWVSLHYLLVFFFQPLMNTRAFLSPWGKELNTQQFAIKALKRMLFATVLHDLKGTFLRALYFYLKW